MHSDFQQGWLLLHWGSPRTLFPTPMEQLSPLLTEITCSLPGAAQIMGQEGEIWTTSSKGGCHTSPFEGEGAAAKDLNGPMRQAHRPGTRDTMGGADAITERSVTKSPFSKPGLDRKRTRRLGPCQKRAEDPSEEGQRSS